MFWRGGQRFLHLVEDDKRPAPIRAPVDLVVMPPTLMSICSAMMPAEVSATEVHHTVMIFGAGDVAEHGILRCARPSPAHRDAGDRLFDRYAPASIIASDPPHTLAIDEEPLDSRMSDTRTV
jgi:hypothetical protein